MHHVKRSITVKIKGKLSGAEIIFELADHNACISVMIHLLDLMDISEIEGCLANKCPHKDLCLMVDENV